MKSFSLNQCILLLRICCTIWLLALFTFLFQLFVSSKQKNDKLEKRLFEKTSRKLPASTVTKPSSALINKVENYDSFVSFPLLNQFIQ